MATFFEAKVRPVLVEQCASCHGAEKQSGGLRVDSRAAILEGGDLGPSVVPGDPDNSPLIQAIRHQGDNKMPPKGGGQARRPRRRRRSPTGSGREPPGRPTRWVRSARRPTDARRRTGRISRWATPPFPRPRTRRGWRTPVDGFILQKLEAAKLTPSAPADRRTLIRRATFDLIGLPPTVAEIDAFLADDSPEAYPKVVDRLLASPRYGERWGRHWLDVARYADTKGYVFNQEKRYPYSYTYRDYVIGAFNDDLPYDRFVVEQIAADRLPRPAESASRWRRWAS